MSALCAESVSFVRIGSAEALIWRSLPLSVGYCGTSTAVIFPSVTVIDTWTGPQRVEATEPATVVAAPELVLPELVLSEADVPEPDDPASCGADRRGADASDRGVGAVGAGVDRRDGRCGGHREQGGHIEPSPSRSPGKPPSAPP
jgi:hypothetical protein